MPSVRPVMTTAPEPAPADRPGRDARPRRRLRTALALAGAAVVGGLALAAGGLWFAAERVPDFYAEALADIPPPAARADAAAAFAEKTAELAADLHAPNAAGLTWEQRFSQTQINSWLAVRLPERYGEKIPDSVSDPRVDLSEEGRVRLGFRLSNSKFDGVVSLAVRPEVTAPNRLALHVEGLFAGLLPIDPARFAPRVSAQLDKYGVDHEWIDPAGGEGPPVLTVAITPRRPGPGRPVLEELEIDDAGLRVSGRRLDGTLVTRR